MYEMKYNTQYRARDYKTFFMLNSVEHEPLHGHRYKNIKKFSFFQTQVSRECFFFLLINVKMPAMFGILTCMSTKISCSIELSMKKVL